jgi:hypothetical protein
MGSTKTYILTFEWSESPFHQGAYRIFLSYHPNSQRWALSASRSPSGERLSWKIGDGNEDQRAIAIELLRKSHDRGALTFDLITHCGPFEISIKDFAPPKKQLVRTNEPIEAPRRVCKYCRYLVRPQGFAANMARIFDCSRGNWTDRERGVSEEHPSGFRAPKLDFTCQEFAPEYKTREESYY